MPKSGQSLEKSRNKEKNYKFYYHACSSDLTIRWVKSYFVGSASHGSIYYIQSHSGQHTIPLINMPPRYLKEFIFSDPPSPLPAPSILQVWFVTNINILNPSYSHNITCFLVLPDTIHFIHIFTFCWLLHPTHSLYIQEITIRCMTDL